MKKRLNAFYLVVVLAVSALLLSAANARAVSEEARRHIDRGQAAVEMAKAPEDYAPAIKEFEQAIRLAPDWPAPYYNLWLAQEKAGKFREAVTSFKQYLRLAQNASDAATVKSLINKLEFKAEQFISDSEALDIFASLGGYRGNNSKWNFTGDISPRGTAQKFWRVGDKIEFQFQTPTKDGWVTFTRTAQVNCRILEYDSFYNYAPSLGIQLSLKVAMEIVSRSRIKGSAVETGWKDGLENIFEFEYIFK